MNQRRLIRIAIAIVLVAALIPSVYAFMVRRSRTVENVFTPAVVDCDVEETFEDNVKSDIMVRNTGNTTAYIRVRLVFNWQDSAGTVIARNVNNFPPVSWDTINWFKVGDTYYYRHPVEPGDLTLDLLTANWSKDASPELHEGLIYYYYPVMEVLAEAIQADGVIMIDGEAVPAVQDAWEDVVVNKENGTIKAKG